MEFDASIVSSGKVLSEITRKYDVIDISLKEPDIDDIIRNMYIQSENLITDYK